MVCYNVARNPEHLRPPPGTVGGRNAVRGLPTTVDVRYRVGMKRYANVKDLSTSAALKRLALLTTNLDDARMDLEDFLMDLHDDETKWNELTYAQMATTMGVTRQAVQQRVMRLIDGARARRGRKLLVHPEQLTLTD